MDLEELIKIRDKVSDVFEIIEIINDHFVDIVYLKNSNTVEEYNSHFGCVVCKLTKEKFDLLKRYFK